MALLRLLPVTLLISLSLVSCQRAVASSSVTSNLTSLDSLSEVLSRFIFAWVIYSNPMSLSQLARVQKSSCVLMTRAKLKAMTKILSRVGLWIPLARQFVGD